MADFEVKVVRVEEIIPIEKADNIEAVRIGGYQSIVMKGQYKVDDLVAYIPCGSIVPGSIIKELGLEGRLAGGAHNRVKEIKLRGCLSEGLVYPAKEDWYEEDDVTAILGIIKYDPGEPPAVKAGNLHRLRGNDQRTMKYDIENIKKYPNAFEETDIVSITSKIHGTLIEVGVFPDGTWFVTSKGLAATGFVLNDQYTWWDRFKQRLTKWFMPWKVQRLGWHQKPGEKNLYLKIADEYNLVEKMKSIAASSQVPIYLFGEIYGPGVQDLTYGAVKPEFRAFDVYFDKRWANPETFFGFCKYRNIPTVPELYRGPYSKEIVRKYTDGKDPICGLHMQEGIVIKAMTDRPVRGLSRLCLKSVSAAYLTRKGNTTEYS